MTVRIGAIRMELPVWCEFVQQHYRQGLWHGRGDTSAEDVPTAGVYLAEKYSCIMLRTLSITGGTARLMWR